MPARQHAVLDGAWRIPAASEAYVTVPAVEEALDAGYGRGVPIVVQAPTGSGKTMAVAAWLRSHPEWDALWIAVTARDIQGLRHLADAAAGLPPSAAGEDAALWWARLVSHLGGRARPLVLVLDGVDRVEEPVSLPRIVEALEQLANITLVLISQRPIAHLDGDLSPRVHVVAPEFAWDASIACTAVERAGIDIPSNVIELIRVRSGGRAEAVIECAAQWEHERRTLARERRRRVKRLTAAWFLNRASETLGDRASRLMLVVASLLEVPHDLALRVGAVLEGAATDDLANLIDHGFLVERRSVPLGRTVYAVPASIATELRVMAREREPELCRRAHALAASIEAMAPLHRYHRARAGLGPSPAGLVLDDWRSDNGPGGEPLAEVLQSLPVEVLVADPVLAALRVASDRGYGQAGAGVEAPYHDTLLALTPDDRRRFDIGDRLLIEGAIVDILLLRDNPSAVVRRSQEFADQHAEGVDQLASRARRALCYLLVGVGEAQLALLRPDRAMATIEPVLQMGSGDRWLMSRYRACVITAMCFAYNAEYERMRSALVEADLYFALGGFEPGHAQSLQHLTAFIDAVHRGDVDDADASAVRFAAVAPKNLIGNVTADILAAAMAGLRGGSAAANARFARIIASPRFPMQNPATRALALVIKAESQLNDGRPGAALELLRGSVSPGSHALCFHVYRAAAHLSLGQPLLALEETRECVKPSLRHLTGSLSKVFALRAAAHLELRHPEAARSDLRSALHRTPAAWRATTFGILPAPSLRGLRDLMAQDEADARAVETLDAIIAALPTKRSRDFAMALTRKETELLALLSSDITLSEVARRMFVSINTIKTQSRSLYRKLGVGSRREAVDLAYSMAIPSTPVDDAGYGELRNGA